MSEPDGRSGSTEGDSPQGLLEDEHSQGPSLTLIYGLIALALVAAIGFALLIVLPFYHRR